MPCKCQFFWRPFRPFQQKLSKIEERASNPLSTRPSFATTAREPLKLGNSSRQIAKTNQYLAYEQDFHMNEIDKRIGELCCCVRCDKALNYRPQRIKDHRSQVFAGALEQLSHELLALPCEVACSSDNFAQQAPRNALGRLVGLLFEDFNSGPRFHQIMSTSPF